MTEEQQLIAVIREAISSDPEHEYERCYVPENDICEQRRAVVKRQIYLIKKLKRLYNIFRAAADGDEFDTSGVNYLKIDEVWGKLKDTGYEKSFNATVCPGMDYVETWRKYE